MATKQTYTDDGKKTTSTKTTPKTSTATVGGREVNTNTSIIKSNITPTQSKSIGSTKQSTPAVRSTKTPTKTQNVTVGGRDITSQVEQQRKNEALNVPKTNPVIDKIKSAVSNVFQMAGEETGRMKLKNDYTAQRNQAKLNDVNAQNMDLANSTTPEMYQQMFTPNGQRVDNSKTIEGIKNEMQQLDAKITEIGNDDMAIAEISRRNELQEQLDAFADLDRRAQAIEELGTQKWLEENGDEQGLASYQEMLSHKNDSILERSANALNHLGNTTMNIIPTAFDQMEELGSNKMAMDSIATLEEMHNSGEIDDATYLESLAQWQDYIDVHKSTNSDNLSQIIRANADRLSANTYYGASDIEKFCLQAGESTAQFLLHFALLGEAATVSMSLASGTDKMNQLLMEGVDPQTAAQNGLLSGLVSYATEKIGMDRFVNMMGTPFSADALGSIVINQLKSGLSEGLEEVAEGLVDPLIDSVTLGTPYEVNGDELKMEFLLGGASGLAMAVGGTVLGTVQEAQGVNAYINERRAVREAVQRQIGQLVINTQYQKNQVVDEINMLKKHYNTMTESQKEVAREVIAKGENAINVFEQMTQVPGVSFSTDFPETTTTEQNDQAIYQTYTPDFNNEVRFEQKISETESLIDELMKNQIAADEINSQAQQILAENGYDIDAKVFNSIDERQQEQTLLAHDFAKALGYDVDIVNDLGRNIHGKRAKDTGRITIDASMGKNPVLQTLTHEITHGTESGSRYDELKKLVRSNFTDEQWNAEIERIQDVYKRNAEQELAPEDAEKEIVAKYVENNLNDEDFIEDLIRYNFSLASRIKQNMKSFFSSDENQNFKTTFEKVFKSARTEMIDKTVQAIKDGFEGMIGENYVSKNNLQMSVAQYDVTGREILEKYLSDPESNISEEAKNAILDRMEEVYKAMKEFEETGKYPQFSQWQDTFYSINDRGDLSVVINNGDYELNIDFSTVCKKRKMMDKVINALTKNGYLSKALKNTDIAKIREIIDKHGFEVACGLCFVDTKRFNQGAWAGRFETKWNGLIDQLSGALDIEDDNVNTFNFQAGMTEATPALQDIDFSDPKLASFVALSEGGSEEAKMARALINNPSLRSKVSTNDMYGSSGFEALQKANPELFKLVNASGGSSKPKLAHTEVTYFNEIINSPKFNPNDAKKVGGVRLQSFSDFMTNMVFDYVQMFADMEAKKLTGHSYTKVKEYALLFGKTGMKINLSLIPAGFDSKVYTAEQIAKMGKKSKEFLKLKENAGLDENGDYMFDKESFDFDLAVEIQNLDGYDKNVGTICVGVSDKHILKLLSDDRICMVIPYHRSGISPLVADKMGISTFNDYTNKQNTRFKKPNGKPGKKIGKNFDFNFYEGSDFNGKHFAGMIENNYDAKKTADSYKAWCEANDYVPKFGDNPEILNHPNYYKLLIDFRAYDKNGNVAPQESVKISGDSGIGTEYVPLDAEANPKLAELYGDNIGFNNVLEKGLDIYEETEANQNEAIDPISQEVIDELGLEKEKYSLGGDYGLDNLRDHVYKNPNSKYKDLYYNIIKRQQQAEEMVAQGKSADEIHKETGWVVDLRDGLKFEFYDDGSINKIFDWAKKNKGKSKNFRDDSTNTLIKDILGEDSLFLIMYPKLANTYAFVSNTASKTWGSMTPTLPDDGRGHMRGDARRIRIGRKGWEYIPDPEMKYIDQDYMIGGKIFARLPRNLTDNEIKHTIAHELQHVIQLYEKSYYGKDEPYPELPGEKEAELVGAAQVDPTVRIVDENGNIISYDDSNAEPISPQPSGGDEKTDESTDGDDSFESPGELEDSNGSDGQEVSNPTEDDSGNGTDDSEPLEDDPLEEPEDGLNVTSVKKPESVAEILTEMPKPEGFKDILKRAKLLASHYLVNRYSAVDDLARRYKNERLTHLVDKVMRSQALANVAIYNGLFDSEGKTKIGKSLTEIMGRLPKEQKADFYEYMYHYRNIDEMSMKERFGDEYEDIPVFDKSVTAEDSREKVAELEKQHPEFKQIAEDLWDMNRKLLQMRVDAGIISKATYDKFVKERPHYVRIMRNADLGTGSSNVDPNDIKKFRGSKKSIMPLEETMRQHILSTYRVAANNELNSEIIKTLGNAETDANDDIDTLVENEFNPLKADPKGNRLYAYKNGKKYSIPISSELYKSLAPKVDRDNALKKIGDVTLAPLSKARRAVLTNLNPLFTITNFLKDVQGAYRNTKYASSYTRNLVEAISQVLNNGELSRQYDNLGIRMSQYAGRDVADAFKKIEKDKGFRGFLNGLTELSETIEKIPRLAEFISSLEAGNTVEQAAYDAAEVTTNFKRGGTLAKTMDKYGFTFLNASIQGFDKEVRMAKGDVKKMWKNGIKGIISTMAQFTLAAGIPLRMLQDWLWKEDDEYKELSDYVKNNYYIVGKRNGRFIRIPKGRIAAFYQTVMSNAYKTKEQKMNAWDALLDDWQSFNNNVAPNNFLDNNLLSPLTQVAADKTWYGEKLLPSRLDKYQNADQYDETTSSLAIKVGELSRKISDAAGTDKLQISPYKLNYLFDQYSGIIGDVLIPATTLQTDVGISKGALTSIAEKNNIDLPKVVSDVDTGLAKGVVSALADKFTTDPVIKNQNVSSFYSLKDVIDKQTTRKDATEESKLSSKYLGTVASAMGKLYGEMHDVQGDPSLSNKEKLDKVRAIKQEINEMAKDGLANYDNIDIVGDYAQVGGVQYYKGEDGWRKPSKSQLEKLGDANLSNEDRDGYFKTWSEIQSAREDIKAKTPEGQKANYTQTTVDSIRNSNMSAAGKNTLFDSYYDSKATNHINAMDLSDEDKFNLKVANKLAEGTKDENGKTVANSKAQAVADAYKSLGLLDDVLEYIKDNDIAPSELGLSKTVYNQLVKGTSGKSSSKKSSSGKKSKGSKSSYSGRTSSGKGKVSAGNPRRNNTIGKLETTKIANNFFKAYANTFNRTSKQSVSSASSGSTCPNCGARVSASATRCPTCGAKL